MKQIPLQIGTLVILAFVAGFAAGHQWFSARIEFLHEQLEACSKIEKASELPAVARWRDLTPAQKKTIADAIGPRPNAACRVDTFYCDSRSEDEPCDFAQQLDDALSMSDWDVPPSVGRSPAPPIAAGITITYTKQSRASALRLQGTLDQFNLKTKMREEDFDACILRVAVGSRFTK